MKEHPIIFSSEMICAILEGRKTQTRRIIKFPSHASVPDTNWIKSVYQDAGGNWIAWSFDRPGLALYTKQIYRNGEGFKCPYGQPGDSLWVRETWQAEHGGAWWGELATDHPEALNWNMYYRATERNPIPAHWRPSIFMPRWASRITLEIASVRVERLQNISEEDVKAEGITGFTHNLGNRHSNPTMIYSAFPDKDGGFLKARDAFEALWNSIHAKHGYGWDINPWVWVIAFQVNQ